MSDQTTQLNTRLRAGDAPPGDQWKAAERIEALKVAVINLLIAADDIDPTALNENYVAARDRARALVTQETRYE
jgi:hypothetical protein